MKTSTNVYLSALAVSDLLKLLNDLMYFVIVAVGQTNGHLKVLLLSYIGLEKYRLFGVIQQHTFFLTFSCIVFLIETFQCRHIRDFPPPLQ